MLQIRKKILVGTLCAGMVLSASQSVAWSENSSMTAEAGTSEAITSEADGTTTEADESTSTAEAEDDSDAAEEEKEPITEEGELAKCELVASNSNYELYVNMDTGLFAFRTAGGAIPTMLTKIPTQTTPRRLT